MNEAARVSSDGFVTTADLAARSDFTLGLCVVSPSARTIAGPGGTADVEPRVMQVLVVLAEANGQVVTRETLFQRCWGGVYVGDDSLNRAIGAVRRLGAEVGAGSFAIETIPRTGYRLSGSIGEAISPLDGDGRISGVSRRGLVAGGAAAALLAGGGLWALRSYQQSEFDRIIERAETAVRDENADPKIIQALETAVAIHPGSAKAWGLLALFNVAIAQLGDPKDAPPLIGRGQQAARRAFSIDRNEPNALMAMFELEGSTLDWFTRDRRLRQIIAIDPTHIYAIAELVLLLQAAGLTSESRSWNERAISLVPLSLDFLVKRAFKLWDLGRVAEADKVIDQVRALYPTAEWPWFCRFLIFATTDRAEAARAMLDANPRMIPDPLEMRMWRAALAAIMNPSPTAVSATRNACFDAAKVSGQTHGQGVMILSQLRDVDGAYAIANGSLLALGPIIRPDKPGSRATIEDAIDRVNMQWIWTPPCKAVRADPRFAPLCDGIGLTEYWRRRGVRPDYLKLDG